MTLLNQHFIGYFVWNFHSNRLLFVRVMQENKTACFYEHSVYLARDWRRDRHGTNTNIMPPLQRRLLKCIMLKRRRSILTRVPAKLGHREMMSVTSRSTTTFTTLNVTWSTKLSRSLSWFYKRLVESRVSTNLLDELKSRLSQFDDRHLKSRGMSYITWRGVSLVFKTALRCKVRRGGQSGPGRRSGLDSRDRKKMLDLESVSEMGAVSITRQSHHAVRSQCASEGVARVLYDECEATRLQPSRQVNYLRRAHKLSKQETIIQQYWWLIYWSFVCGLLPGAACWVSLWKQ